MTKGSREKNTVTTPRSLKVSQWGMFSRLFKKVAPTDAPVLIFGKSGVGKELVAQAIHEASGRNYDLFNAFNCSALNDNLLESELFGHEKGSYTNATQNRKGLFESSRGGTIFFDEIGDMSPSFQRMLLPVSRKMSLHASVEMSS